MLSDCVESCRGIAHIPAENPDCCWTFTKRAKICCFLVNPGLSVGGLPIVDVSTHNFDKRKEEPMFDKKGDYALNKLDPDAIVCKSATGVHIRLTRADFTSEEEFLRWKEWSDRSYYETAKADARQSKHTYELDEWSGAVQSPEDLMVAAQEERERQELCQLFQKGLNTLTAVQRRRLWLYCVENLTVRQIAEAENVSHPSVVECLMGAKKKLQKFLGISG